MSVVVTSFLGYVFVNSALLINMIFQRNFEVGRIISVSQWLDKLYKFIVLLLYITLRIVLRSGELFESSVNVKSYSLSHSLSLSWDNVRKTLNTYAREITKRERVYTSAIFSNTAMYTYEWGCSNKR